MKRIWWSSALGLSFILTQPAKGGGIVQEMKVAPNDLTQQSATTPQHHRDPNTPPSKRETSTTDGLQPQSNSHCATPVRIEQLPSERSTRISWKSYNPQGKQPVKYLIYRRTEEGGWELIGEVDGSTFSFTDRDLPQASRYSYRVVAVYELESGNFQRFQYPSQSITLQQTLEPIGGIGCQATPWQHAPSLFFLLLLIPLLRRRPSAQP